MLTIELARVCGWNPEGTRRMASASSDTLDDVRHLIDWQTGYVSNDGQTVSAPDAIHLAEALSKASLEADRIIADWAEGRSAPPADIRTSPGGFRWLCSADGKAQLQTIADFCRGGAFQIF